MFQHLVPPPTVNHSVMKETIATLGIDQDGQVNLVEKGYLYKDIFVGKLSINRGHRNLFSEVQGDQLNIGDFCDFEFHGANTLTLTNLLDQKILHPGKDKLEDRGDHFSRLDKSLTLSASLGGPTLK